MSVLQHVFNLGPGFCKGLSGIYAFFYLEFNSELSYEMTVEMKATWSNLFKFVTYKVKFLTIYHLRRVGYFTLHKLKKRKFYYKESESQLLKAFILSRLTINSLAPESV